MRRALFNPTRSRCFLASIYLSLSVVFLTSSLPQVHAETVFGVVGDWGVGGPQATHVANMITNSDWDTDYILTLGDNNYGRIDVGDSAWDFNVGTRYGDFIQQRSGPSPNPYPQQTSATQRFFPTVGNHDSSVTGTGSGNSDGGIIPGHIDYFHTDPDNPDGRLPPGVHNSTHSYYDVELPIDGGIGSVRLFAMDSDSYLTNENSRVAQTLWLQQGLQDSTATWNFVYFHHTAYSSSRHGNNSQIQLPFQRWGADAVLAAHDHIYERLRVTDSTQNEMLYFVNGLGGANAYELESPVAGSEFRYNLENGAMRITATDQTATFEFLSISDGDNGASGGLVIDSFTLDQNDLPLPPASNADFDNDGFVDSQDLSEWQMSFGDGVAADADGDSDSDGADFLVWQQQFDGDFVVPPATMLVPEPSSAALLLLFANFGHCLRCSSRFCV